MRFQPLGDLAAIDGNIDWDSLLALGASLNNFLSMTPLQPSFPSSRHIGAILEHDLLVTVQAASLAAIDVDTICNLK